MILRLLSIHYNLQLPKNKLLDKIIKQQQKAKNWGLIVNHWVNIDVRYLICKIIIFRNLETLISNKKRKKGNLLKICFTKCMVSETN